MLFENRRSRCKELGKKVPQAYRVYVEDTFLPYDIADACIFSKKTTPEFYVFYNGEEVYPSDKTLKLSDTFIEQLEQPNLELIVHVVNINQDIDHHLLAVCQPMREYSIFVQTVRKWQQKDPVNGFKKAIAECIANNILREYLERKTKEVINMLLAEYDYETDIAVQRAESYEQGIEQGFADGVQQTALALKQMGLATDKIVQATGLSCKEIEKL